MTAPGGGGNIIATAFVQILPLVRNFASALRTQLRSISQHTRRANTDLRRLDRNLSMVGKNFKFLATAIVGINTALPIALASFRALAGVSVVGGLTAMAGAFTVLSGVAGVLPSAFLAAGAAAGTLAVGLFGAKDAFKALVDDDMEAFNDSLKKMSGEMRKTFRVFAEFRPQLKAFKDSVQDALFFNTANLNRDLIRALLPRIRDNFVSIARSINAAGREVANFLLTAQTLSDVDTTSSNISLAFKTLIPVGRNLAQVFRDIAVVGSNFLPGVAAQMTAASASLREFISEARASGALETFIGRALAFGRQILQSFFNVGKGISAILFGSREAGLQLADAIANLTGKFADFFTSIQGQVALADFLDKARQAAQTLGPIIAAIAHVFINDLLPILLDFGNTVGPAVTTFIRELSSAFDLAKPGIEGLAIGFRNFLVAMIPAQDAIGALIGALGILLGSILDALGPALAELAQVIARALVPIIYGLADAVRTLTTEQVKWTLIIALIVTSFGPLITAIRSLLVIIGLVAGGFGFIFSAAGIVVGGLVLFTIAIIGLIKHSESFRHVLRVIGESFGQLWNQVKMLWQELKGPLLEAFNALQPILEAIGFVIGAVLIGVVKVITFVAQAITGLIQIFNGMPPVLQAVTLAVGAFIVGIITVVPAIATFSTAMGFMGTAAGGLVTRLVALRTFLLGPWGLAIGLAVTVLGAFAASTGTAQRRQEELSGAAKAVNDSIREQNGVINDNVRAVTAKQLEDAGALKQANELGISTQTVTDAVLQQGNALDQVRSKLEAELKAMRDQAAMEESTGSRLAEDIEKRQALLDTINGLVGARDADNAAAQRQTDASGGLEEAAKRARDAFGQYADALDRVFNGLVKTGQIQLSARDAIRGYHESITAANEALATNGATLDVTTAAGQRNQAALDGVASATLTMVERQRAAGESTVDLQGRVQAGRDEFIRLATGMGLSKDEAGRLADTLRLIPGLYKADVRAETEHAQNNVKQLQASLDRLKDKTITISTINRQAIIREADLADRATGGPLRAGQLALVGEEGPELVRFDRASHVFTNPETNNILGSINNRTAGRNLVVRPPGGSPGGSGAVGGTGLAPIDIHLTLDLGSGVTQVVDLRIDEYNRRLRRTINAGAGGTR